MNLLWVAMSGWNYLNFHYLTEAFLSFLKIFFLKNCSNKQLHTDTALPWSLSNTVVEMHRQAHEYIHMQTYRTSFCYSKMTLICELIWIMLSQQNLFVLCFIRTRARLANISLSQIYQYRHTCPICTDMFFKIYRQHFMYIWSFFSFYTIKL